ncbi:MAG: tryptophan 7-halogenase [Deltaproteobacteria bacterium]|nr:tryptophan 7-halogenase [Deltaproteobacteria bacterium]MCB9786244.1 tryptophan 7-halogenase [Deltaproteobacteria bacterium]
MGSSALAQADGRSFDVVICGGGLAGLTLARQLRRELPDLSVALIERTARPLPDACHKVGESSVELGSQYLERLGLRDYLHANHLLKFGLRFFPGGGHMPLEQRTELGPANDPIMPSYQLDRGRLENDLRDMDAADGVVMLEGVTVRDIALGEGGAPHTITAESGEARATLSAGWVVDATGRNALLRKRLKLKRGNAHDANAGWFRIEGRFDVASLVPRTAHDWHSAPFAPKRWLSTVHLMGEGYWVWLIPLSSGKTSVGVVVHDSVHGFDSVRSLERCLDFIRAHEPLLADALDGAEILDFLCLNGYSHQVARCWSPDRWALVGEAGAFVDPLYSPGTDFIAFANSFTTELMRFDRAGGDLHDRVRELNIQYRSLVSGATGIFRHAAPVYGHARAMAAKIYWDNFSYWCFPCQYFLQDIYRLSGAEHEAFGQVGARYVELSDYAQVLVSTWARMCPEPPEGGFIGMPQYPSALVDVHLELADKRTPDETMVHMKRRLAEAEQIVAELLIRIVLELGPERGREFMESAGVAEWDLSIAPGRFEAESLAGRPRRRALPAITVDLERNLGPIRYHAEREAAMRLLGHRGSKDGEAAVA